MPVPLPRKTSDRWPDSRSQGPWDRQVTARQALTIVFLITMVALNVLLRLMVVRPAREIAAMADEVSLGKADVPEYVPRSKDEIASLAESFNRMRRSLANAMKLLGD